MRNYTVEIWWRYEKAVVTVRAFTRRGAIMQARGLAKLLKPGADFMGCAVR